MKLSVFGLGKLGSPFAALMAAAGNTVIGVDVLDHFIDSINRGIAPVEEPGLQDAIDRAKGNLSATTDVKRAVMESDVSFLVLSTPSAANGRYSLEYMEPVCRQIGEILADKDDFHVIDVVSTVLPTDMDNILKATIEAASGKKAGIDFGLCYNPEFIALGSVVKNMLRPDFVLIGESDPRSGDILESIYRGMCENDADIHRCSLINAEIIKISINTFVTTKISFANTIAALCRKLPGADAEDVCAAIGRDSRIGTKYLNGGLAYGGPCFPRDNRALGVVLESAGINPAIGRATDEVNRQQTKDLAGLVKAVHKGDGPVAILGLSYKPHTPVVEESAPVHLAQMLVAEGIPVTVFDPAAMDAARHKLENSVTYAETMSDAVSNAGVVVVATAWPEFDALTPDLLAATSPKPTLIDCWNLYDAADYSAACVYLSLGKI